MVTWGGVGDQESRTLLQEIIFTLGDKLDELGAQAESPQLASLAGAGLPTVITWLRKVVAASAYPGGDTCDGCGAWGENSRLRRCDCISVFCPGCWADRYELGHACLSSADTGKVREWFQLAWKPFHNLSNVTRAWAFQALLQALDRPERLGDLNPLAALPTAFPHALAPPYRGDPEPASWALPTYASGHQQSIERLGKALGNVWVEFGSDDGFAAFLQSVGDGKGAMIVYRRPPAWEALDDVWEGMRIGVTPVQVDRERLLPLGGVTHMDSRLAVLWVKSFPVWSPVHEVRAGPAAAFKIDMAYQDAMSAPAANGNLLSRRTVVSTHLRDQWWEANSHYLAHPRCDNYLREVSRGAREVSAEDKAYSRPDRGPGLSPVSSVQGGRDNPIPVDAKLAAPPPPPPSPPQPVRVGKKSSKSSKSSSQSQVRPGRSGPKSLAPSSAPAASSPSSGRGGPQGQAALPAASASRHRSPAPGAHLPVDSVGGPLAGAMVSVSGSQASKAIAGGGHGDGSARGNTPSSAQPAVSPQLGGMSLEEKVDLMFSFLSARSPASAPGSQPGEEQKVNSDSMEVDDHGGASEPGAQASPGHWMGAPAHTPSYPAANGQFMRGAPWSGSTPYPQYGAMGYPHMQPHMWQQQGMPPMAAQPWGGVSPNQAYGPGQPGYSYPNGLNPAPAPGPSGYHYPAGPEAGYRGQPGWANREDEQA